MMSRRTARWAIGWKSKVIRVASLMAMQIVRERNRLETVRRGRSLRLAECAAYPGACE